MKALSLSICFACLVMLSCKEKTPEHYIEFQGKNYKEPVPVQYDSNGDGKIDATDDVIEVLGNSLNVSQTPDGKPLYKTSEVITPPGSPTGSGSLVPTGERLCYHDLQRNCDSYGGLYAFETSMNTTKTEMKQISESQKIDADNDGVLDYINVLRDTKIEEIVTKYYAEPAALAEQQIEDAASKQISTFLLENAIQDAIRSSLLETLYENDDYVDIAKVEQKMNVAIAQSIIDAVYAANLQTYLTTEELNTIAFSISQDVASKIANDISSQVAKLIVEDYNQLITSGDVIYVQGICPNGYHIPSDIDWMIFEMALGMPAEDLTKYGETVTNRGASSNVVHKMVDTHGMEFGGYASINGTYSQLGEAGVYWSSSVGTDSLGDYAWVRQIDTSYTGVVRYKHYEKSGLSIRCFKNNN